MWCVLYFVRSAGKDRYSCLGSVDFRGVRLPSLHIARELGVGMEYALSVPSRCSINIGVTAYGRHGVLVAMLLHLEQYWYCPVLLG